MLIYAQGSRTSSMVILRKFVIEFPEIADSFHVMHIKSLNILW